MHCYLSVIQGVARICLFMNMFWSRKPQCHFYSCSIFSTYGTSILYVRNIWCLKWHKRELNPSSLPQLQDVNFFVMCIFHLFQYLFEGKMSLVFFNCGHYWAINHDLVSSLLSSRKDLIIIALITMVYNCIHVNFIFIFVSQNHRSRRTANVFNEGTPTKV